MSWDFGVRERERAVKIDVFLSDALLLLRLASFYWCSTKSATNSVELKVHRDEELWEDFLRSAHGKRQRRLMALARFHRFTSRPAWALLLPIDERKIFQSLTHFSVFMAGTSLALLVYASHNPPRTSWAMCARVWACQLERKNTSVSAALISLGFYAIALVICIARYEI